MKHLFLLLLLAAACARPEPLSIQGASAHWISSTQLVWDAPETASRFELRYSLVADIEVSDDGVTGGERLDIQPGGVPVDSLTDRYRHIQSWPVFRVDLDESVIKDALKGQLVAIAYDDAGNAIQATRVQTAGVIDELFAYDGVLGPQYGPNGITLTLWAPTAQSVSLNVYDADKNLTSTVQPESTAPAPGVYRFTLPRSADRAFYTYTVSAYHPENGLINNIEVTDPYSVSLSTDSKHSQLVDLSNDRSLKPAGWDALKKSLPRATDITLYEAHMRDFSIFDESVPAEHRGTYLAFTHANSTAMRHLKRLSDAGLSHLHLLPLNDIGSVIEDRSKRTDIQDESESGSLFEQFVRWADEDPTTERIQRPYSEPSRANGLSGKDGFNWGYDPVHFNVPEGSYSTEPDGPTRIRELRQMVGALHGIGLNVVVDVVYNHTYETGLRTTSVLDKIVPGYYYRSNPTSGAVETSTCCFNTAAEHVMMEKLIIDSVILWAKQYKIDSFRFDLMGHHPKSVLVRLREELAKLTLERDGVDGKNIYIYGEGWNFGEVADNRIFEQATQFNMGGTGIGNFNDRMRDGIRGGNFTDRGRFQGFTNGQFLFPNEEAGTDADAQKAALLEAADRIRVGLAGNLSTYIYQNRFGEIVNGRNEWIGYTLQPQETINYIDKHDNETFWDNTQTKLPNGFSMEDRVKVHLLSNAMINYGQGVPFFHMGTDILRSKSLDRNSYDSGDWFNRVDFTMETHNWGRGLPPVWDNSDRWDAMRGFLTNPNIQVTKKHMTDAHNGFLQQLRIRYLSPLFRLLDADDVHKRVAFHNTGPDQVPGLIVMSISDAACGGADLDPALDGILVVFNATLIDQVVMAPVTGLRVHPFSKGSESVDADGITVPALSAGVFVKPQRGARGEFVCNTRM